MFVQPVAIAECFNFQDRGFSHIAFDAHLSTVVFVRQLTAPLALEILLFNPALFIDLLAGITINDLDGIWISSFNTIRRVEKYFVFVAWLGVSEFCSNQQVAG